MKYSKNFNRDFNWYLSMRHIFNFDGALYNDEITYDKNGVDGKKAFHLFDSQGKLKPTKHPNLLRTLLLVKGSTNLHIKMYAEDRASGLFPLIEFRALCIKFKSPMWFRKSVERQKYKYYGEVKETVKRLIEEQRLIDEQKIYIHNMKDSLITHSIDFNNGVGSYYDKEKRSVTYVFKDIEYSVSSSYHQKEIKKYLKFLGADSDNVGSIEKAFHISFWMNLPTTKNPS